MAAKRGTRALVTVLGLAGLVAGTGLVAGCDPDLTERRDQSYEVPGAVSALEVSGSLVDVTVRAGSGPVRVEETLRYNDSAPSVSHRVDGSTLRLDSKSCRALKACRVSYTVRVPAGTRLAVDIDTGSIETTGLTGDLDLDLSAGRITVRDARSRHADITADAGDVDLTYAIAPDRLTVSTAAGDVDVNVPGSQRYDVQAHTDAGSADVRVPQLTGAPHSLDLSANVGDIDVKPV